ncbi:hypothetical protein SERLADRAFT_346098 [Serpula lacrymans var. lacrymans S7.9]|nr:uncharacterized protein SERLADRAFT_346098 [Serpula lacrymans var. lacrymans S7.9]EGO29627.1 hypothetical protein SERLADRAFT_346098 [Serpula lacrymans var. lacrymans S7.9]
MPPRTRPIRTDSDDAVDHAPDQACPPAAPVFNAKRKTARSLKLAILLVPMALILIAASTRYITHPAAFDLVSADSTHEWDAWSPSWSSWRPHKRHPQADLGMDTSASLSTPGPTGSSLSVTSSILGAGTPTSTGVPAVPMNPVLPTPFPQPFDTTLSANFSTEGCYSFFQNMTNIESFRVCRPFSLLLLSSTAFIEAENNITQLNNDIWGTCNTDLSQSQCDQNMASFASTLQSVCQTDLAARNAMAVNTLIALNAYDLMRTVACQTDPTSNAYCYIEADAGSDPSASYFYQLPLGQPLPNITNLACTACTKSLLASYASALSSSNSTGLTGLQQTYGDAAKQAVSICGSGYAQSVTQSTSVTTSSALGHGITKTGILLAGFLATCANLYISL